MHVVGAGTPDVMLHVEKRLVVQEPGLNIGAQLLETLHGDVVEGGYEYPVLHVPGADLVNDPLLQPAVKDLVVFQLQIQKQAGLFAEIQKLAQGPDVLPCESRGLPRADVQRQQLVIGHVLDKAGAVGGALHGGIVENDQFSVF